MNKPDENLWIVTSAWPTINNIPHLGTILHLLSADVISRYLSLIGEKVISVSGSDAHGTPVLLSAEAINKSPQEYVLEIHKKILYFLDKWSITLDNYTITTTNYHKEFVQNYYTRLKDQKVIFSKEIEQYFCESCQLFLPDRFIEGTCPKCHESNARGDQCSNPSCNIILTPDQLLHPYCKKCKSSPSKKKTSHYYLDLEKFESKLKNFINSAKNFTPLVVNESLKFFNEGLQARAITRDLSWGIDASQLCDGQEKVFYVWAEDVLGYLSASAEYLEKKEKNTEWKGIWTSTKTKTVYCLGLDNIFFHAIWLPGLLLAYNDNLRLPDYLSTTQFIQFNGQAFSKSKNIGLWIDEAIKLAPADVWRFYLVYNRPEKKSFNFEWATFSELVNTELIANVFNLVYRLSTLVWKYLSGSINLPLKISQNENKQFIERFHLSLNQILKYILQIEIRDALRTTIKLIREINGHLSRQEPWKKNNLDEQKEDILLTYCATVISLHLLQPVIPTFSKDLINQLHAKDLELDLRNEKILNDLLSRQLKYKLPPSTKLITPLNTGELIKEYNQLKAK